MEACVEYVSSAINAEKGGAIRLELCSALSEGGLTPSVGLLKQIKKKVKIPVCVMIRPRTGNDFVYSEDEIEIMEEDVRVLRENGADGFVFGALKGDSSVDVKICQRLLAHCSGLPVTFHRAFDMTSDPIQALDEIVDLGFARLLTSGQQPSADKGAPLIKRLIELAGSKMTVMPGCGINASNLNEILTTTGASEFHATARDRITIDPPKSSVSLGHVEDESVIFVTSVTKVSQLVSIYNTCKKS